MPTQAMKTWIKNYKDKNGRAPSPGQVQQAQERIYKQAASERARKKLSRK